MQFFEEYDAKGVLKLKRLLELHFRLSRREEFEEHARQAYEGLLKVGRPSALADAQQQEAAVRRLVAALKINCEFLAPDS